MWVIQVQSGALQRRNTLKNLSLKLRKGWESSYEKRGHQ
jgi:hypothetical protein